MVSFSIKIAKDLRQSYLISRECLQPDFFVFLVKICNTIPLFSLKPNGDVRFLQSLLEINGIKLNIWGKMEEVRFFLKRSLSFH